MGTGQPLYRVLQASGFFHLERAFCLTRERARRVLPDGDGLSCEPLDLERLEEALGDAGSGLERSALEQARARGDWGVGVFDHGRLASHCWFTSRPALLRPGLRLCFDPSYAYGYWAFTRTEQRGRALHSLGKSRALELCAQRGLRGILSAVRADNGPSLRSAERIGCLRVGSLLALGPASRPWTWTSRGCDAYGLRLERAAERSEA